MGFGKLLPEKNFFSYCSYYPFLFRLNPPRRAPLPSRAKLHRSDVSTASLHLELSLRTLFFFLRPRPPFSRAYGLRTLLPNFSRFFLVPLSIRGWISHEARKGRFLPDFVDLFTWRLFFLFLVGPVPPWKEESSLRNDVVLPKLSAGTRACDPSRYLGGFFL